ncbi:MAG: hypothetical protein ACRBB0_26100 [Pelagimonas sp.]|uniref:hypothetical protein n=1 Tax=Pelagimonas sp. TaxID=2073170 RepID=UPI003D6A2BBC
MKRIFSLFTLIPGAAFAHGGHAPLPAGAHEVSHMVPVIVLGVIVVSAVLWWMKA